MKFSAISSGSSGNCFYIENKDSAILVDAGISSKRIKEGIAGIGGDVRKVRGIFITHEHGDHVRGADVFAREFNIPIYATKKTAKSCLLCSDENLINSIKNSETIRIRGMGIGAFSKSHKAEDPVSYSIENGKIISVITDAGFACNKIIENVQESNLLCLEANHDIEMLENGPYPFFLKKWIKGDTGHLSNSQAGLLVLEHGTSRLKNIVLAHLSQINNTPKIALRTFNSLIKDRINFSPRVLVSERFHPTLLMSV